MKKIIRSAVVVILTVTAFFPQPVWAQRVIDENHPLYELTGTAILLLERSTGRVLYERNADMHIYPASMIKVLTSIVMLDHIAMDDIVVVGNEIDYVPFGSSRVGHELGEHITGLNLLRGLMLPSGNDTANVAANRVATLVTGRVLEFDEAQAVFTALMNERARQIGMTSSNFVNAHGFHDPDMQVTARDLAILADYAIDIPMIRQVAGEMSYVGYTVPPEVEGWETMRTRHVTWNNTNRLLIGVFYHPDVTGLKTGFHTPAGHTFLGTAERNGIELISVIGGSYNETRFVDTSRLFDYAFDYYDFHPVHVGLNPVGAITIENPRWGEEAEVSVFGTTNFSYFLNQEELAAIEQIFIFDEAFLYHQETVESDDVLEGEEVTPTFLAPLHAGDVIGRVIYRLDGQDLFYDNVVITEDVLAWSYLSSFWYLVNYVQENPFSIFSLSLLLGVIFICIIAGWIIATLKKIGAKHNRLRRLQRTNYKF